MAAGVFGLAFDGGSYVLTSRHPVAIAIWWALILAVALSVWPLARPTRTALGAGFLLAAFALVTGLSLIWAESAEKAFVELDRVLLYLGVFVLAVIAGTRENARRWRDGIALGLVAVALLALASRLFGDMTGSRELAALVPETTERLSYPVDYWNGLAILTGLAFPLLLASATAHRERLGRLFAGLSLAPLPALVAVIYLASSRGGAATAIVGTVMFAALTTNRLAAIAATLCAGAGSAVVITVLQARPELVDGPLDSAAAASQGESAAILIALACLATGALYAFAANRAARLRFRPGPRARAGLVLAGVLALLAAFAAVDPSERFERFKRAPDAPSGDRQGFTQSHLLSSGGSGRWQFWSAAADEWETRRVLGRGAGSYEAWWAEHGTLPYFVRDAHSLYLETLAELGVVGLGLLGAAFVCGLLALAGRRRGPPGDTVSTAAFGAAFLAFATAAAIDWVWELTVVGVVGILCLGLLCGPARAGASSGAAPSAGGRLAVVLRSAFVLAGLAVVVAQAVPLLAQNQIRASQDAAARGDTSSALESALAARGLQGWAASPHLQIALVEERTGDIGAARSAIEEALERDRSDWRLWLVAARLEAKSGRADSARERLRHARGLNPRSPLLDR